jgi:hypothetical protein
VHFVCLCSLITFVLFTPIVILAFNPILCKMNSKSYKTCDKALQWKVAGVIYYSMTIKQITSFITFRVHFAQNWIKS